MEEQMTAEQKADLDAAVQAEMAVRATPAKAEALQKELIRVHGMIVDLCGQDAVGAVAYCRSMAISRLEEVGHRIGDAVNCIMKMQQMQDEAIAKAAAGGNIVKFPGGPQ